MPTPPPKTPPPKDGATIRPIDRVEADRVEADRVEADRVEVTRLLVAWRGGDANALEALVPIVYRQLREIAHVHLRREHSMRTLQPTELVHEVYLRLVDADINWQGKAHFFAVAGRLMRRMLVDESRKRGRQKRGGERPLRLDDFEQLPAFSAPERLLELDHALSRLEAFDERKARVIEARIFAGLTIDETAKVLDVSTATVERELRLARSWLARELLGGD